MTAIFSSTPRVAPRLISIYYVIYCRQVGFFPLEKKLDSTCTPDHLLLDSAPNLGPLISSWEINKFKNCAYKIVRILDVLKLLFQQFLNMSSSQRDMSDPILADLSNNR